MYKIQKTMEVSAAHQLNLPYASKCNNFHGHNWIITVYCAGKELNNEAMLVDFSTIKEIVMALDHKNLNDILNFPTTAENLAHYIQSQIQTCYKVDVQESSGNIATYEDEAFFAV